VILWNVPLTLLGAPVYLWNVPLTLLEAPVTLWNVQGKLEARISELDGELQTLAHVHTELEQTRAAQATAEQEAAMMAAARDPLTLPPLTMLIMIRQPMSPLHHTSHHGNRVW
jgi:hypothetical protein